MHFRNSCTRSTSTWAIRHVPSGASGGRGLKRPDASFWPVVPRHVGNEVADRRESCASARRVTGAERSIWFRRVMHISRGLPFDLGRTRAAFSRLAVPADSQIVRLFGLDLMDGVQDHHPFGDGGRVVREHPAVAVATPDPERRRGSHDCAPSVYETVRRRPQTPPVEPEPGPYFIASIIASNPAASPESGRVRRPCCRRGAFRTTMLIVPRPDPCRDSPRGSVRRGSPFARARSA